MNQDNDFHVVVAKVILGVLLGGIAGYSIWAAAMSASPGKMEGSATFVLAAAVSLGFLFTGMRK